jgi:hypothetical protein
VPGLPFDLSREAADRGNLDALVAAGALRIGLDGVLAERGTRAWRAWVRGSAAERGFRWNLRDTFDRTWWPQGVDVAEVAGGRVLAVSWYAQPVRGVERGVRLTFVDLRTRRPRYHHVLLAEVGADATLSPVRIHAGGIAWLDDVILVADTFGGLREFRLDDLLRVREPFLGARHVLPQHAAHRAAAVAGDRGMRFSFVSIEHTDGPPWLVTGEYGDGRRADRLARLGLDGVGEMHEPGLSRMQGVCIVDGTWYVTTSNGEWDGGDLWVGTPGALTRHRHVLPAGPEDLAYDRVARRLWSLSEWPGRRRVFTIDPARWGA